MSYRVLDDFRAGIPKTLKDSQPYKLIACHWTAGGTGFAGAVSTIGFFVDTAAARNASYHELWAYDEPIDQFSVVRIVRKTHCAHSLNPTQPPTGPYDPDAWVRQALGADWFDPNQGVYAVSIAGGATATARYANNPKFVAHAKRRIGEIRAEIPGLVGLAEHFRFQNNKDDWGPALSAKLGGVRFEEDDVAELAECREIAERRLRIMKAQAAKIVALKAKIDELEGLDAVELLARLEQIKELANQPIAEEEPVP